MIHRGIALHRTSASPGITAFVAEHRFGAKATQSTLQDNVHCRQAESERIQRQRISAADQVYVKVWAWA